MSAPLETQARKHLVLARIALERLELRRDLAAVRRATQVPELLSSVLGAALGTPAATHGARGSADWIRWAWRLIRRYKGAATLLAAAGPLLGRLGRVRPVIGVLVAVAAAWSVWRASRARNERADADPSG